MGERICSINGCRSRHYGRGWCRKHYKRWLRHGDPLAAKFIRGDDAERFSSKIREGAVPLRADVPGACQIWTGYTTADGYGGFDAAGKSWLAHRYAYVQRHGSVPDGLQLDHLCRNRACVNPDHLEPVTLQENVRRGEAGAYQKARTHCPNGHEYTADNTYEYEGRRYCRECGREKCRKQYQRRKELIG